MTGHALFLVCGPTSAIVVGIAASGMALVIPLVQVIFKFLLPFLVGFDQREEQWLTRRGAVRLSALRRLGPVDPACDPRGREDKFCLRELRGARLAEREPARNLLWGEERTWPTQQAAKEFLSLPGESMCPRDQLAHCDRQFLDAGIRIVRDEDCLNGPQRVVADGFLTQKECDLLVKFGEEGSAGNGHFGKPSPMTKKELYTGYRLADVIQRLHSSSDNETVIRLILAASDRARLFTEAYFRLKKRLYMHLVQVNCRTAFQDSTTNRTDMSHQIHADNCQFQDNASCPELNQEFKWRNFTAALYLNDDAHGGEIVFATTPRTKIRGKRRFLCQKVMSSTVTAMSQAIIRPKCGRMVSINSRNPHGVLPVFSGRRCSVLVWMTHTKEQQEFGRPRWEEQLNYTSEESFDPIPGLYE